MPWFVWLGACVSDLALLAATIVVASFGPGLGMWLIVGLAWRAWWQTGNFDNWRPAVIRQFFENWRKYERG